MKQESKLNIENHYHIQSLIEGQQRRVDEREYFREKQKEKLERNQLIQEAHMVAVTDFYCDKCKKDFKSMAIKQIESDWLSNQFIAFYKTKCDKNHWCIRYITDKHHDPYWMRSRAVARDRGRAFNDIIQPGETGFNLLYGKK